jgi:hypothetical protein
MMHDFRVIFAISHNIETFLRNFAIKSYNKLPYYEQMIFLGQFQTKPRLRYTPTAVEQLPRVAPEVRQGILITHG